MVDLFPEARMLIYKPASCRVSDGANRSNLFTELLHFTSKISNKGEARESIVSLFTACAAFVPRHISKQWGNKVNRETCIYI
jgi:hypothetical protein